MFDLSLIACGQTLHDDNFRRDASQRETFTGSSCDVVPEVRCSSGLTSTVAAITYE